jgi:hypothetical protein
MFSRFAAPFLGPAHAAHPEHDRARDEDLGFRVGVERRVEWPLGDRDVRGLADEPADGSYRRELVASTVLRNVVAVLQSHSNHITVARIT